jgi:hypothetical protein
MFHRDTRGVSFPLLFQSTVGISALALAATGTAASLFGSETTMQVGLLAAAIGALFGAVLALRH